MLSADTVSPLTDANIEAVGAVRLRPRRIPAHPKAGTGNKHKTPRLAFFFFFLLLQWKYTFEPGEVNEVLCKSQLNALASLSRL